MKGGSSFGVVFEHGVAVEVFRRGEVIPALHFVIAAADFIRDEIAGLGVVVAREGFGTTSFMVGTRGVGAVDLPFSRPVIEFVSVVHGSLFL